jgi:hypothetical protein
VKTTEEIMNKKKTKNDKTTTDKPTKQMKVFLNNQEHTVVTAAANMKGMNLRDYMKAVVVEQAKKDAKEISRIIDSL